MLCFFVLMIEQVGRYHFKVKIRAQNLWQYKIAFLPSEKGPSVTSREEKWSLFNAFVSQYINKSLDESGFNATMVQSNGIGMVFDGEGLAYYYKDLEKENFWEARRQNWKKPILEKS